MVVRTLLVVLLLLCAANAATALLVLGGNIVTISEAIATGRSGKPYNEKRIGLAIYQPCTDAILMTDAVIISLEAMRAAQRFEQFGAEDAKDHIGKVFVSIRCMARASSFSGNKSFIRQEEIVVFFRLGGHIVHSAAALEPIYEEKRAIASVLWSEIDRGTAGLIDRESIFTYEFRLPGQFWLGKAELVVVQPTGSHSVKKIDLRKLPRISSK